MERLELILECVQQTMFPREVDAMQLRFYTKQADVVHAIRTSGFEDNEWLVQRNQVDTWDHTSCQHVVKELARRGIVVRGRVTIDRSLGYPVKVCRLE